MIRVLENKRDGAQGRDGPRAERRTEPAQCAEQRRLAAAVGTQQDVEVSPRDAERRAVEGPLSPFCSCSSSSILRIRVGEEECCVDGFDGEAAGRFWGGGRR